MKVLVVIEVGVDLRIPPQREPRSGRVRMGWLVPELEPASARALEIALSIKAAQPDAEIAVLHLGPADNERWLRWSIARGCSRAARVWDKEAAHAKVAGEAVILAAAAQTIGFDLLLSGSGGAFDAAGHVGVLLAELLGLPCVTQVTDITVPEGSRTRDGAGEGNMAASEAAAGPPRAALSRALERGYRERVEGLLPLVAAVHAGLPGGESLENPAVRASALLAAEEEEISVWGLEDLGVPLERVRDADQALRMGEPRPVRPRLHPLKAPDPALPAFERVLELVAGAVERRAGRVIQKPPKEIVEEIFQTLRDEGWLDHLRPTSTQ